MRRTLMGAWVAASLLALPGLAAADTARAIIASTVEDGSITVAGEVALSDTPQGLLVEARLIGVPPGSHGFHIHQFGSCDDLGMAAGGHFNQNNAPHGDVIRQGVSSVHPGDLGNITAGGDGVADYRAFIEGLTLTQGPFSVAGRAIILHSNQDDFGQPAGNAGGRIACGTIVLIGPYEVSNPKAENAPENAPPAP